MKILMHAKVAMGFAARSFGLGQEVLGAVAASLSS
jgi:hypothetical protein